MGSTARKPAVRSAHVGTSNPRAHPQPSKINTRSEATMAPFWFLVAHPVPQTSMTRRPLTPFATLFHGSPSVHLWEDDMGDTHEMVQGAGESKVDPLMPLLFSLGQRIGGSHHTPHRRRVSVLFLMICLCCVRQRGSARSTSECITERRKFGWNKAAGAQT